MLHFSGCPVIGIALANVRTIVPSPFATYDFCVGDPPYQLATGTENDDYDIYIRWSNGNNWIYATSSGTSSVPTILARFRGTTNLNSTNNFQKGNLLIGTTENLNSQAFCDDSSAFNNALTPVPTSAEGPAWVSRGFSNATYSTTKFYIDPKQALNRIYVIFKIYTTTYSSIQYYGNVNLAQTAGVGLAAYNFWLKNRSLCCPNNINIRYLPTLRLASSVADSTAQENFGPYNGSNGYVDDTSTIANRGLATLDGFGCLLDLGFGIVGDTNPLDSFVYSFKWNLNDPSNLSYASNYTNLK
jgi:hypothetical protein